MADGSGFGGLRTKTGRRAIALGTSVVLLASCAAATTASTPPDAGTRPPTTLAVDGAPAVGGSLVVGIPADTNGWDPGVNQLVEAGSLVGSTMLEPLFTLSRDGEPQPLLAESATPNADLTEWTVKLRAGVTFSDGTPLTADVVKQNIEF